MTTQAKGPQAGFGWLQRGVSAGYRHPKPILGSAVILLLIALVPTLLMLPIEFRSAATSTPPSAGLLVGLMAASMLIGLLLVPLYAGYLQVIDAAERGLPARVGDIFAPYLQGDAPRLIGYAITLVIIYVALMGIVILAAGRGIVVWYLQLLSAQANHLAPPGLPQGFGIAMALFTVMGLFMLGFYSVSLGQVALRRRGVFSALGDGFLGALKNLLPLLVLAICLVIAWIIVAIVIGVVAVVVALLAKLVGAWLMFALVVPIYIAFMLAMFAIMFGVMYHLWRDVCEGDTTSGPPQTIAA